MKRREATFDLYLSDVGGRTLEVECSVPTSGCGSGAWYLPLAFLPKKDVAPNLEVTDGEGRVVPVPTKHQNFALTKKAIEDLVRRGNLSLGASVPLRKLIDEVVVRRPVPARTSRTVFERNAKGIELKVVPLLRLLEDNFVLWVPAHGSPGSHHHFRVSRQEIRHPDRIIARRHREVVVEIPTALGSRRVRGYSSIGWPTVRWRAAIERLLKAFALRPIETRLRDREAGRAASSHLRVHAPPGFRVRNVRVAEILPTPRNSRRRLRELDPAEEDVVIQGWDQKLGHVHLSKEQNPPDVYCRMTLGLQGGSTTLWMLATVFTAALLWVVHHHSRYGPTPAGGEYFQLVLGSIGNVEHRKLSVASDNKQIVAAALLVGPAFVSAWSLRAEGGELLRSFLAGSRMLLLLSAALSVAAALALADVLPTHAGRYAAVEVYAGISYFVAAPMLVAWLLSSRPTWDIFRKILNSEWRNLIAIASMGGLVAGAGFLATTSARLAGLGALAAALGMAVVAANSIAEPLHLGRGATIYRPLAGFGSLPVFVLAGSWLGFYADGFSAGGSQLVAFVHGVALAISATSLTMVTRK